MAVTTSDRDELIAQLQRVSELYNQGGDTWRATSFAKAATAVRRIPDSALQSGVTKSQLTKYAGIGPSTADVILEFIRTGQIETRMNLARRVAARAAASSSSAASSSAASEVIPVASSEPNSIARPPSSGFRLTFTAPVSIEPSERDRVINLFKSIHGVGNVTAGKWYDRGWRSLDDARAHFYDLTHAQRLGLTYHADLERRIPHAEIRAYGEMFGHMFPGMIWQITGSYRRGCVDSGDIDILVQADEQSIVPSVNPTISSLVAVLKATGSWIGTLGAGDTKFMGIVHTQYTTVTNDPSNMSVTFTGPARRLDIRIVPRASWPYALLYFTGSADLNKQMRVRAINRGWTLSEYGMTNQRGELIPAQTERDIFRRLEMNYLEPIERNI